MWMLSFPRDPVQAAGENVHESSSVDPPERVRSRRSWVGTGGIAWVVGYRRRRSTGACRPRMIGPSSAMCRQASRIESAAAWSRTVQVSDPTRMIAVRDAESYRALRSSSPWARMAERRSDAALPVDCPLSQYLVLSQFP